MVKGGETGQEGDRKDGIKFDNRQTKTQKHSFSASVEVSSLTREGVCYAVSSLGTFFLLDFRFSISYFHQDAEK